MKKPRNYDVFSKIAEEIFFRREFCNVPEETLIAQRQLIKAYITLTYLIIRFSYEPDDSYYIWKKNIRYVRQEVRKGKIVDEESISILFKIHLGVYACVRRFVLTSSKPKLRFELKEKDVPEKPEWEVIDVLSDTFFPSSVYRSQKISRALSIGTNIIFEKIVGRIMFG